MMNGWTASVVALIFLTVFLNCRMDRVKKLFKLAGIQPNATGNRAAVDFNTTIVELLHRGFVIHRAYK
jgi:hypothetical protein